jgi:S1-C subfamily serine protease
LLNEEGKVVGMNSVMLSREGGSYGFAIPYILIQKVINDLEKYKEVRWANFGISIDDPGVTIKELSEGAAKKGGIEVGDQIISIKTEQRHLEKIETIFDLITFLSTIDYQTKVRVIVKRGESLITLDIEPGFKLSSNYAK